MTGGTKSDKPIKLLIVDAVDNSAGLSYAKLLANRKYEVTVITPRQAKQYPSLKPNDQIVPWLNVIPETHVYFPHAAVEPNRRQRRKNLRKNKQSRNGNT
jgi:hypothetical protein